MRRRSISPDQVEDAVRLYESGWSLARIGHRLGVNPATVLNRLRGLGMRRHGTRTGASKADSMAHSDRPCPLEAYEHRAHLPIQKSPDHTQAPHNVDFNRLD